MGDCDNSNMARELPLNDTIVAKSLATEAPKDTEVIEIVVKISESSLEDCNNCAPITDSETVVP